MGLVDRHPDGVLLHEFLSGYNSGVPVVLDDEVLRDTLIDDDGFSVVVRPDVGHVVHRHLVGEHGGPFGCRGLNIARVTSAR